MKIMPLKLLLVLLISGNISVCQDIAGSEKQQTLPGKSYENPKNNSAEKDLLYVKDRRSYLTTFTKDNSESKVIISANSFDRRGNMLEDIKYNNDGNEARKISYVYDGDGNKIEEFRYIAGNLNKQKKYCYDGNGNRTEEARYTHRGDLVYRINYEYDKDNNKIKEIRYSNEGKLTHQNTYIYNTDGKLTELTSYDPAREDISRIVWKYDNAGNKVIETEYHGNRIDHTYTCEYDENNHLIKEEKEYSAGTKTIYEYSRDESGNITGENVFDAQGNAIQGRSCKYDGSDRKTEECILRNGKQHRRYIYTYNSSGDMTGKVTFDNDDNITESIEFGYDTNRNLIKRTVRDWSNTVTLMEEYKFDGNNNKTEETRYSSGDMMIYRSVYKYNDYGNVTQILRYDSNNRLKQKHSFEYEYYKDLINNRILKTP